MCYLRTASPRHKEVSMPGSKQIYFDFEACTDEVHECEEGYTPPVDNPNCAKCRVQGGIKCVDCRRCTICRKSKCGTSLHRPNLVVAQTSCDSCKQDEFDPDLSKCARCGSRCENCKKTNFKGEFLQPPCQDCGYREVVFEGFDCSDQFTNWLINMAHKNFVGK